MDSSFSYKSETTGMTSWEYQDRSVVNCQTDMTLFILILNLFLTVKRTFKINPKP